MLKKIQLPNGTTVLLCPLRETEAVTVLIDHKIGSRYEAREVGGVSHFIEHLLFKGTKRRPSSLAITRELDRIGAEFNAYTSKDHTAYYIKAVRDQLPLAVDILADMLHHSLFKAEEINRERGVIIEEIKMYEDNPMMHLGDYFDQCLYGDHPLGWNIAGKKEIISTISRANIVKYFREHYHADRRIVTIAGNFREADALRLVRKAFGSESANGAPHPFLQAKPRTRAGVFVKYKDTQQVHMAMGAAAYPWGHPHAEAATLLAIIMGGTMSSRLFISVRERKGLCYYIRAGVSSFEDTGDFTVSAGVDLARVELAIRTIGGELKRAQRRGVTAEELKRAKEYIKGKVTLELEDSASIAEWYSKQMMCYGKTTSPEEKIKKFQNVTLREVAEVAARILDVKKYTLAVIGPFKDAKRFERLLRS